MDIEVDLTDDRTEAHTICQHANPSHRRRQRVLLATTTAFFTLRPGKPQSPEQFHGRYRFFFFFFLPPPPPPPPSAPPRVPAAVHTLHFLLPFGES